MAEAIEPGVPGSVIKSGESDVWVESHTILEVCKILKNPAGLDFSYLLSISAVDYIENFELVYHLVSMRNNCSGIVKLSCS